MMVGATLAVAGAGYVGYVGYKFLHPPQIRVTSVGKQKPEVTKKSHPSGFAPKVRTLGGASQPATELTPPDMAAFYQSSNQLRTVTSSAIATTLERKASLSDDERKYLDKVFKIASTVQRGIDAEPSANRRQEYQKKLIEQMELRFRLILKDDARYDLARSELSGLPRIDVDG